MTSNNLISLHEWKEFKLQPIDEDVFSQYRDIVFSNTDENGKIKNNPNLVNKIFLSFLTHNYNSYIYETIHFVKLMSLSNFTIWDVSISSNDKIKNFLLNSKLQKQNGSFDLNFNDISFSFSLGRIPVYKIIIDFLEAFIGLEILINLDNKIVNLNNKNDIILIVNDVSQNIYNFLKEKIPTSHNQKYAVSFVNLIEKFTNKTIDKISFNDIDDKIILNFWDSFSKENSDVQIKSFKKIFELSMLLINSLRYQSIRNKNILNNIEEFENFYNFFDVNNSGFEFVDGKYNKDSIGNEICYFEELNDNNINLFKKTEIQILKIFKNDIHNLKNVCLSFYRNLVFSEFQNKIIEGIRRRNYNFFENYNNFDLNLYKENLNILSTIINNCDLINQITFIKLWENEDIFSLSFLEDFLDENEKIIFKKFIKQFYKNKDVDFVNDEFDSKRQKEIKNFLIFFKSQLNNSKYKKEYKNFIEIIKTLKKNKIAFRRKGFRPSDEKISNKNLYYISRNVLKIKQILQYFLKTSREKCVVDNFFSDLNYFFKQFSQIYEIKLRNE